jgi:hypothetical protein
MNAIDGNSEILLHLLHHHYLAGERGGVGIFDVAMMGFRITLLARTPRG